MYVGVIKARLRSIGISAVFSEALYSSWRGWARLLLHFLGSIAGDSSEPPEEFSGLVFIASMMTSLVILMSDSVFASGCPKKSFGSLIVSVGSEVPKTQLYCSFSRLTYFFLLLGILTTYTVQCIGITDTCAQLYTNQDYICIYYSQDLLKLC